MPVLYNVIELFFGMLIKKQKGREYCMILKRTKPTAGTGQIVCAFFAAILLLSVLSGCKNKTEQTTDAAASSSISKISEEKSSASEKINSEPSTSDMPLSESEQQTSTIVALNREEKAKKAAKRIAKKRIQSDIDLALWYVREKQNHSSSVSYSYENGEAAYSKLKKAQKKLYKEMLEKVKNFESFEYTAKEHGYKVLDNVLVASLALCEDHPEYGIYFDIEEVFKGDMTTALKSSYFFPNDPDSKNAKNIEAVKKEVRIFEEECNLIVNSVPKDFSTYDKYRFLAAVISIRTAYDNDFTGGKQTSTAYGAIQGPIAICQGYATGFEYLCRKADLWCKRVSGISQGVSHSWNLVKLESGTYHVDVTWADSDLNLTLDNGWQRYFMLTQDEILIDHEIDDGTVATGTLLTEAAG